MENVVEWIICQEFDKKVGRWQLKNLKSSGMKAMEVRFSLRPNYEREEGYRHLTIRLFAPQIYVFCLAKEEWDVAPMVPEGQKFTYTKGDTGWILFSYHNSCWRSDGIHSILWKYIDVLESLDCLFLKDHDGAWYKIVDITEEELNRMFEIVHKRDHGDFSQCGADWRDKLPVVSKVFLICDACGKKLGQFPVGTARIPRKLFCNSECQFAYEASGQGPNNDPDGPDLMEEGDK